MSGSDDLTTWLEALRSRCCRPRSSRIPDGRRRRPQCIMCHGCYLKERYIYENVYSRRMKGPFKMNSLDSGFIAIYWFESFLVAKRETVPQTRPHSLGDSVLKKVTVTSRLPQTVSQILRDSASHWVTVTSKRASNWDNVLRERTTYGFRVALRYCLKLNQDGFQRLSQFRPHHSISFYFQLITQLFYNN